MKTLRCLLTASGLVLAATLAPMQAGAQETSAPTAAAKLEPGAYQALQRMSAYLGTLNTFQVTADTSLDLVLDDSEKMQLNGVTTYKVKRPDRFVIDTVWDRKDREFIYDGKQITIYAPKLGFYAQAPAPPTIKATLDKASDEFGIDLPLQDLFYWADTGANKLDPPEQGFFAGEGQLGGVPVDQYVFRDGDLDWQIWIQKGATPLPLKLVIVDRSDPARPQYAARLTWNTNPQFDAATFTFTPGKDDHAIKVAGR